MYVCRNAEFQLFALFRKPEENKLKRATYISGPKKFKNLKKFENLIAEKTNYRMDIFRN
jgi:hypothetical protein